MKRLHGQPDTSTAAPATVTSVARHAGVSVGTVSRVLNNHPRVSAAARQAVERAIRELDYRPDPVARSLRRRGANGRVWTGNIGVFFPNTTHAMLQVPFMSRMVQGVQSELADNGYHLIISNTTDSSALPDLVRDRKVEGLLVHGDLGLDLCSRLTAALPAVSMGQHATGLPIAMVNVDNRAAVVTAATRLFALGHRRIGFVARDPEHRDFAERRDGYRQAVQLLDLRYDPALEAVGGASDLSGPRTPQTEPPDMSEPLARLLDLPDPPTALIVPSDWQAIGVYRALAARRRRIPDDLCVIGFDNDPGVCHSLTPALSSINYPSEQIGRQAVRLLLNQIREGSAMHRQTILIKSELIERASIAPVKRS